MAQPGRVSYVLPLRWSDDTGLDELASYLRELAPLVDELIVVDGSDPPLFDAHARAFGDLLRHIRPDPALDFAMGKVSGVTTGVRAARNELVVIADDDVRYDRDSLERVSRELEGAHLVRPQNYFDPLPWHARIETARTLLNRVHTGDLEFPAGDFPGTLAIRRSAFEAVGGYDGDVIFENLELMRTVAAAGGIVVSPLDLFVRRLPPETPHYLGQRVRQAFDDLGVPLRLGFFLALAPGLAALLNRRRRLAAALATLAPIGVAEAGRRRAGGGRVYPASSSLLAPVWVAERAVTSWLAVWSKLRRGGISYAGRIVPRGVNSPRTLRRRLAGLRLPPPGGGEPDDLVGPVAEGRQPRAPAAADGDRVTT
jgi:hypothetical protein